MRSVLERIASENHEEYFAHKQLHNNENFTISRADKWKAALIMNLSDYDNDMITESFTDSSTYKKVSKGLTNTVLMKIKTWIYRHSKNLTQKNHSYHRVPNNQNYVFIY